MAVKLVDRYTVILTHLVVVGERPCICNLSNTSLTMNRGSGSSITKGPGDYLTGDLQDRQGAIQTMVLEREGMGDSGVSGPPR